MDVVTQSSIFFIITSVSVVLVTLMILFILIYIFRIVKDIQSISRVIKEGTVSLAAHVDEAGEELKKKGVMTGIVVALLTAIFGYKQAKKKRK